MQTQVAHLLNMPVTIDQRPQKSFGGTYTQGDRCDYVGPNRTHPEISVSIVLDVYRNSSEAYTDLQYIYSTSKPDASFINGLGEPVVLSSLPVPVLFVQKDNGMVSVGVVSYSSAAVKVQQEKQIVLFALHILKRSQY
jgi:hypothetical protein